jgi:hypothetical protein
MIQMQGGQHVGKLVIIPRGGHKVKVGGPLNLAEIQELTYHTHVVSHAPVLSLDQSDATYLVVGGLERYRSRPCFVVY